VIVKPKKANQTLVLRLAGRCLFAFAFSFCLILGFANVASAAEKQTAPKATSPKAEAKRADADSSGDSGDKSKSDVMVDGKKAKVLSFGAMDVEGKMRTPQLLFFLGRVKAELDSTSQLHRSFIKELKATSKEKGL
jgi:hypothetical protein